VSSFCRLAKVERRKVEGWTRWQLRKFLEKAFYRRQLKRRKKAKKKSERQGGAGEKWKSWKEKRVTLLPSTRIYHFSLPLLPFENRKAKKWSYAYGFQFEKVKSLSLSVTWLIFPFFVCGGGRCRKAKSIEVRSHVCILCILCRTDVVPFLNTFLKYSVIDN
jgi:hypothetical protein